MHLFIFDFDMTLTFLQTDSQLYKIEESKHLANRRTHQQFIQKNMKPDVAEMFRAIWANGHAVAIATFCNDKELLISHLSAAGLSDLEIERITIAFRPDNFEALQKEERVTGQTIINKNGQIEQITRIVNGLSQEAVDGFTFIDDSGTNTKSASAAYPDCRVIRVNNFTDKDGTKHGLDFIGKVFDQVNELAPAKTNSLDAYCQSFFQELDRKINELDRFYQINGTKKANFLRHAITANKSAIQQLKDAGNYDSVNVENILKTTLSTDGKTLKQALGYHRLFSFKGDQARDTAKSLTEFSSKHRFI
tara:strand:+ start:774 stop:1691 length:918 start_codon:yes stop_codon:yes gene_type:complete